MTAHIPLSDPPARGGARARTFICTIHHVPFVRPEPFYHGGKLRVPAARCPLCVAEARKKVMGAIRICRRNMKARKQRPVVMVESFE